MKYLKSFNEKYHSDMLNKVDDILDKISSDGIESLTAQELELLKSQKDGIDAGNKAYNDLKASQGHVNLEFKDDDGPFPFEFKVRKITKEDSDSDDGVITSFHGTMYLPEIIDGNGVVSGEVDGVYELNELGIYRTEFNKNGYTDYDFVEGLEHEYDSFLANLSIDLQQH